MPVSVFEQLADRFKACQPILDIDASPIQEIMESAGKCLFNAVTRDEIQLAGVPAWISVKPLGRVSVPVRPIGPTDDPADCHGDVDHAFWDAYWWVAVVWISRNCDDTAIVFSISPLAHASPPKLWDRFDVRFVPGRRPRQLEPDVELREWNSVAAASADACHFLSRMFESCIAAAVAATPPVALSRVTLESAALEIQIDGNVYKLTESQKVMLSTLLSEPGRWFGGKEIPVSRADKVKKSMHDAVRDLIQSGRNGYRITSQAISGRDGSA